MLEPVHATTTGRDPYIGNVLDVEFEGESPIESVRDESQSSLEAMQFLVDREGLVRHVGVDEVEIDRIVDPVNQSPWIHAEVGFYP